MAAGLTPSRSQAQPRTPSAEVTLSALCPEWQIQKRGVTSCSLGELSPEGKISMHKSDKVSPLVGYKPSKAPGDGFPEMLFKLQSKR